MCTREDLLEIEQDMGEASLEACGSRTAAWSAPYNLAIAPG